MDPAALESSYFFDMIGGSSNQSIISFDRCTASCVADPSLNYDVKFNFWMVSTFVDFSAPDGYLSQQLSCVDSVEVDLSR